MESRAVERGLQWEARCRVVERKLEDALQQVAPLEDALVKQAKHIQSLQQNLELCQHALKVANGRIWQKGCKPPDETDRHLTLQHLPRSAMAMLEDLDLHRPVALALLRGAGEGEDEMVTLQKHRSKTEAQLVDLLREAGVLQDLASRLAPALAAL